MVKICNISDKYSEEREIEVYLTDTFVAMYKYEDGVDWLDLNDAFLSSVGSFLRSKYEDKDFTDENIDEYTIEFQEYLDMGQTERLMFVNYVIIYLDNIIRNKIEEVHQIIKRIETIKGREE